MTAVRRTSLFATILALAVPLGEALPQTSAVHNAAPNPAGCTLRIHVDGFRNLKGNLGTVLYASADGWPENPQKAFRRGPATISTGDRQSTAVWENLPPGDYAVAAIHDENSNARLDRNFLGIPKEGFGFANNPRVRMGPADFRQALVHVTCPVTETTIHLQYK